MAVGDAVTNFSTVSNGSYLDLQPGSGVEWTIHNLYFAGAVEMYWYNGTNEIKFDSDASFGGRLGYAFHCTNSNRVRIKNVSGGSLYIGYDGVQTK